MLLLEGPAISMDYVAGRVFQPGRFNLRAQIDLEFATGLIADSLVVKVQCSRNDKLWADFSSFRDDTGILELEHSFVVGPGGQKSYSLSAITNGVSNMRLLVRASRPGVAGDRVVIAGTAA